MESFGEYLRKERESKSISLEEISTSTKIRKVFLEAIENDDIDRLPAEVFVKGFLQAYSKHVGLNATEVIHRYQNFLTSLNRPEQIEEPVKKKNNVWRNSFITAGVLLIFFVCFMIFSKQMQKDEVETSAEVVSESTSETISHEEEPIEATFSSEESVKEPVTTEKNMTDEELIQTNENEASVQEPLVADSELSAVKEANEVEYQGEEEKTLRVEASEMTWIRVRIDDKPSFEVTLKSGDSITWKATHMFDLLIGNAGGINIYFNGDAVHDLGERGKVVSLTLPREDIR